MSWVQSTTFTSRDPKKAVSSLMESLSRLRVPSPFVVKTFEFSLISALVKFLLCPFTKSEAGAAALSLSLFSMVILILDGGTSRPLRAELNSASVVINVSSGTFSHAARLHSATHACCQHQPAAVTCRQPRRLAAGEMLFGDNWYRVNVCVIVVVMAVVCMLVAVLAVCAMHWMALLDKAALSPPHPPPLPPNAIGLQFLLSSLAGSSNNRIPRGFKLLL